MPIITLITDYGTKDHYVGVLKGVIYSVINNCKIVDLSHEIESYNVLEAKFCIENSYKYFPNNSFHCILVDDKTNYFTNYILAYANNHYFLSTNTGIIYNILKTDENAKVITVGNLQYEKDLFTILRKSLSVLNNFKIDDLGKSPDVLKHVYTLDISVNENQIKGYIVYIDANGACITNISKAVFEENLKNRKFEIMFKHKKLNRIHNSYTDFIVSKNKPLKEFEGDYLALFNENNWLEIAVFKGNNSTGSAKSLLGLKVQDVVTINWL